MGSPYYLQKVTQTVIAEIMILASFADMIIVTELRFPLAGDELQYEVLLVFVSHSDAED